MLRMRAVRIGIFVVLLLGLGCLGWSLLDRARAEKRAPAGWRQLRVGMSTQEVVVLLGFPSTSSSSAPSVFGRVRPREEWYYSFGATGQDIYRGRYVVTFTTGTVVSVQIR